MKSSIPVIKVTIFEDNTILRRGLTALINGSDGFECTGAFGNCDNLIRNITNSKPDVALMDIEMPGMNGIEAVKLMKPLFPEIKILMETIFEDDEKIFQSLCNGAEGYILKSAPPAQLLSAIREIYEGGMPMTPCIADKVRAMFKVRTTLSKDQSFNLTKCESEVLKYLVDGMSYRLAAEKCNTSPDAVNAHVKIIFEKLRAYCGDEMTK
ncbi:MAG: response regulator transcription factor [Bacteroidetes bacterium]|nr:response regulator transcription factor [Bacteroidota bacterium]